MDTGKNDSNIITPGGKPLAHTGPPSPGSPTSRANNQSNNGSQHRATPAVKTKKHATGVFTRTQEIRPNCATPEAITS